MASSLEIRVVTPSETLLEERCDDVSAEGVLGELGILSKHTTFATELAPGILAFRADSGEAHRIAVRGGYAEVRDDTVTILADEAIPVAGIDADDARESLERARAALADAPFGDAKHELCRAEVRWAEVLVGEAARR